MRSRSRRESKVTGELATAGVLVAPKIRLAPVNLSNAWKSGDRIIDKAIALLPNLILATGVVVLILGFLIAVSIVAPSFSASDLIKMLGIGGVAIGFAFQNILQNFLAEILLLIHEPFQIGDQINVTGLEGVVKEIQARATVITTAEGDRVVIPNATLFTNPVTVRKEKTAAATKPGEKNQQSGEAKT